MVIEYICTNCGYTFLDVVIIPLCKCPECNEHTEQVEWEGLD